MDHQILCAVLVLLLILLGNYGLLTVMSCGASAISPKVTVEHSSNQKRYLRVDWYSCCAALMTLSA